MIRDITIGQYYPADSPIHRLDPRTKLFGTLVYIVSLFFADNLWCYGAATLFLAAAVRISRVSFRFIVRGLKAVVFLLLISVSFNLFLTDGRVLWQAGFLKITDAGLRLALFMGLRLAYLVIGSSIMTLTTTPNQLADGLEKSLGFLNRARVPVHEISMMMSIALRFIPILVEETDKIMKAQMARGGFRVRQCDPAGEKHDPDPGAAVCLGVPAGDRSGHGHGGALLPGRRGTDEDEAVTV